MCWKIRIYNWKLSRLLLCWLLSVYLARSCCHAHKSPQNTSNKLIWSQPRHTTTISGWQINVRPWLDFQHLKRYFHQPNENRAKPNPNPKLPNKNSWQTVVETTVDLELTTHLSSPLERGRICSVDRINWLQARIIARIFWKWMNKTIKVGGRRKLKELVESGRESGWEKEEPRSRWWMANM